MRVGGTSVGKYEQLTPISFTVRGPLRSTDTCGRRQPERTPAQQIPSHDSMRSRMRALKAIDEHLESDIIARERVHSAIDNFSRERRVERHCRIRSRLTVGIGKVRERRHGVKGELSAEVMWNRVGNHQVLKGTAADSVVVIWITPRPKAVIFGVRPDRRVVKVRSIWCWVKTKIKCFQARGVTFSPVPIRLDTVVPTFRSQFFFQSFDEKPMPGEEEARAVNL